MLSIRQWCMNETSPTPIIEVEGLADNTNLKAVELIDELDRLLSDKPYVGSVEPKAETLNLEQEKNAFRFVLKI